jgi:hypothetical protein
MELARPEIHSICSSMRYAFGRDPEKQVQWEAFLRRYHPRHEAGAPATLLEVVRAIAIFLGPILEAASEGRRFRKRWSPGGPWIAPGQL